MKPAVSVIIPFYNAEHTLRDAVNSVYMQTYLNIEVILVDDCSTDQSSSIARELCRDYDKTKYFRFAANHGVSKARNKGVLISSGDFVTFLDADDLYTNSAKISLAMKVFDKNYCGTRNRSVVVFSNTIMASSDLSRRVRIKLLFSWLPLNLFVYMTMLPRDFVMPRNLFLKVGGFPESTTLYEDWIFRLRLARISSFVSTNSWDSIYRIGSSGLSKQTTTLSRLCVAFSILSTEAKLTFGPLSPLLIPILFAALVYYHAYVFLLRLSLRKY